MSTDQFTKTARSVVLAGKTYSKIFGIGANKTGSTTLEAVLKLYGLTLPNQKEQEARTTFPSFRTDYEALRSFVSRYDAFQDLPFSEGDTYIALDALFPNSKFILTERDPEKWFDSMCRFHKKIFRVENLQSLSEQDVKNKLSYLFPGYLHQYKRRLLTVFSGGAMKTDWSLIYDKEHYISEYLSRNNRIKKYFMDAQDKLLVLDITTLKDTALLCDFLNIPEKFVVEMPHANKT